MPRSESLAARHIGLVSSERKHRLIFRVVLRPPTGKTAVAIVMVIPLLRLLKILDKSAARIAIVIFWTIHLVAITSKGEIARAYFLWFKSTEIDIPITRRGKIVSAVRLPPISKML